MPMKNLLGRFLLIRINPGPTLHSSINLLLTQLVLLILLAPCQWGSHPDSNA